MEEVIKGQMSDLRRKLDQFGYLHPLGFESLPLVQHLFADLVHTTESLRQCKVESTIFAS
jgi:centrosomal protein CEP135